MRSHRRGQKRGFDLADPSGIGTGQLFVVVFGFLVSSALIFLFGIWVGRDVAERQMASEERVVRVPITPQPTTLPETTGGAVGGDAAFYEQLKQKAMRRLEQTAAAVSPTGVRAVQAATATRPPARIAEKPRVPTTPVPPAKPKDGAGRGTEWADAGWTVQVNATTSSRQATELAQRLRSKGYEAYTLQAPMHGQVWYRVRVGRFANHDKAKELEARLRNAEGLENAYVTPQ